MKSNYKKLGECIQLVDERNTELKTTRVLGINIDKFFMPSVANVIGTDLSKYKLLKKGYFACNPMHVGRDERLPVALYNEDEFSIVSPAYFMFKVRDESIITSEYLMMWMRRSEFDRQCWLRTDGSVRGGILWDDLCRMELPVPSVEEQRNIVNAYKAITNRIELKRQLNDNLAATEQAFLLSIIKDNETEAILLADLVEFIDGDRGINYPTFDEFSENGYCLFLNASNVTPKGFNFDTCMFISEEKDKAMNKGHLEINDIVLTSRGTLGNVAMYDKNIPYDNVRINSGMLIIRPKRPEISPYLLYALLQSTYMTQAIEQFRSGSAQPQLPIKDLQKISFKLPIETIVLCKAGKYIQQIEARIAYNNREIYKLKELSVMILAELSR